MMGVSASTATLQLEGGEGYSTNGSSIPAGTYPLQYTNSISTLVDSDNTTISNITYSLGVDNIEHIIYIKDSQYATTNSTDITWVFPNSVVVKKGDYHLVSIKTDFYSMQYLPMTLSRTMNQTQFSGEGYQKASFTVLFENITYAYEDRLCDSIWTGFGANENKNLNATFLLDTFSTDAPGTIYNVDSHSFEFNWGRSNITLNHVYNFSIVIRVVPNGTSPVIYKPYFGVVLFNGNNRNSGTSGTSTTMPDDMLPPHLTYATASQNVSLIWSYYLLFGKGASFDETKNKMFYPDRFGVFRPSTHLFYLDYNGNGVWNGSVVDRQYNFGISGDIPIAGDWDNNGKSEIGVFRNSTHLFYLDYNGNGVWNGSVVDRQYNFGISGDLPVSGDWNNDGKSEIGVFRNSTHLFYLDYNGNGVWNGSVVDRQYNFGISGDLPISGDWNNDRKSEIGVFRNSTHLFYLDYNGNGVWNNASVDRQYNFGITGDIPISGDWNDDGRTEIGVFRNSTHLFYLDYNGNGAWNNASVDRQYNFGITGDKPVTGKW